MSFKNLLCLAHIPEYNYSGRSPRYASCQRKGDHEGQHRSWSREWSNGDQESKPRHVAEIDMEKLKAATNKTCGKMYNPIPQITKWCCQPKDHSGPCDK